jgi:SP family arabinose:H+ symporter-like MFS transporter
VICSAVLVGAVNLLFTLIGMALIDKLGRKTLLLMGAVGMAICAGADVGSIFKTQAHA